MSGLIRIFMVLYTGVEFAIEWLGWDGMGRWINISIHETFDYLPESVDKSSSTKRLKGVRGVFPEIVRYRTAPLHGLASSR